MADLVVAALEPAEAKALAELRADAVPRTTFVTYRSHCKAFWKWCESKDLEPVPATPETLSRYLLHLERDKGYAIHTARVVLSAIHKAHLQLRKPSARHDPDVLETLKGFAQRKADVPLRQMAAITPEILAKLVATLPTDFAGRRDRAILLVGFTTALRRTNLIKLRAEDVKFVGQAATITVRRVAKTKTSEQGRGAVVPIYPSKLEELCPVAALATWLGLSRIEKGPIFRKVDQWGNLGKRALDGRHVYELVKACCDEAGIDSKKFGAHSLRAGFITTAAKAGVSLETIAKTSLHRNLDVLRVYLRDADALKNGAGRGLL